MNRTPFGRSAKWLVLMLLACLPLPLQAIPNSVVGPVFQANSPLNGRDLTEQVLAAGLWDDQEKLPGDWTGEGRVGSSEISHLLARPNLFGRKVVLLRSTQRGGRLSSLEATFADAGSYFGYFDEKLPDDLDRRAQREEIARRLAARQLEFADEYTETLERLTRELERISGDKRPKEEKVGHTRLLRARTRDYRMKGITLSLLADGQRLIRVTVSRSGEVPDRWLDPEVEVLSPRARVERMLQSVHTADDGTVSIDGLQPLPQGYRPYCGLNSLAMAARHFGLHIDEDWLAVAGKFQNTGSAAGSNLVSLYPAVAAEAGFAMDRSSRFDDRTVRSALAKGFPVVVWRRFSHERDHLHTRFSRDYARNPKVFLPDPLSAAERSSWPGKDAPLHASVITGYHEERGEFLFLESWSGRDTPRRMRAEELAATAYLTFVFHP